MNAEKMNRNRSYVVMNRDGAKICISGKSNPPIVNLPERPWWKFGPARFNCAHCKVKPRVTDGCLYDFHPDICTNEKKRRLICRECHKFETRIPF